MCENNYPCRANDRLVDVSWLGFVRGSSGRAAELRANLQEMRAEGLDDHRQELGRHRMPADLEYCAPSAADEPSVPGGSGVASISRSEPPRSDRSGCRKRRGGSSCSGGGGAIENDGRWNFRQRTVVGPNWKHMKLRVWGVCRAGILLTVFVLLFVGCGRDDEASAVAEEGARPTSGVRPSSPRVVTLSPQATRFVIEIGARHQLVGIDSDSRSLLGLDSVSIVDLESLHEIAPDLVLVPRLPSAEETIRDLQSEGIRLVEFTPHDMEDVYGLCRGLGAELVGVMAATLFERGISRPMAILAGRSPPMGRPRIVALVGIDPPELAGGHSFETDLIEVVGGSSATHGGEDTRIKYTPALLRELGPDLVLVTTSLPATEAEVERARAVIPDQFQVAFFDFERDRFWLRQPVKDAERLRVLLLSSGLDLGW